MGVLACVEGVTLYGVTLYGGNCRNHTLQALRGVYDGREKLNLQAIQLMVPQVSAL